MAAVTKLKLRWHKQRMTFKVAFVQIASTVLANYILHNISKIAPTRWLWITSVLIGNAISLVGFIAVYVYMYNRAKNKRYHVNLKERTCVKDERRIQYKEIEYSQSLTQKMFGLVTVTFKNSSDKIVLRDISEETLKYL